MEKISDLTISVVQDFSRTPGARSVEEGKFSGEEFLEKVLRRRFEIAMKSGAKLYIDLDGVAGYATSFLEATFGGLAREFGSERVLAIIELKSVDEPYLIDEIQQYVREARP